MKGFNFRLKKDNKGMSLIEILVTLAIISIIAAPLLNSFLNAMKTNSRARLIQNGTSAAQDVAEMFKAFEVEEMVKRYEEEGITVDYDEDTGVYLFNDIAIEGDNGENFVADVKLDPSVYSGGTGTNKNQVNNVSQPAFSGLHGSDSIVIQKQYTRYDDQLKEIFAGTELPKEIVDNIYDEEHRKNITKSTDIEVNCKYDKDKGIYNYIIYMCMTYRYTGNGYDVDNYGLSTIQEQFNADEIQSIYMICPIFDRYNTAKYGKDNCTYATDAIKISFKYEGEENKQQPLYFYIAEQETKKITANAESSAMHRVNPRTVWIDGPSYPEYYSELKAAMANPATHPDFNYYVFTNIGDADNEFMDLTTLHDLTKGDNDTGTALYKLEVVVKLEGETDTLATFTTTR